MMSSLLWTADFELLPALQAAGYALCVLSFCFISGYLWVRQASLMDLLAHRATWLAAAAAVVSIAAWYLQNPFPESRLEPLGVMHHQNKAASAYGIFLVLCMHYVFTQRGRENRWVYASLSLAILCLMCSPSRARPWPGSVSACWCCSVTGRWEWLRPVSPRCGR